MEVQFDRETVNCLRTVMREVRTQEQTQEIRLHDEMPDIGSVIACWGQPVIRNKEWRAGGMSVVGGITVWVLYEPEDGGLPQSVEGWLPFHMKWDFEDPGQDGSILAEPLIRSVDARLTSARKLMVRGVVSVLGMATVQDKSELFILKELPEDVQKLVHSYPLSIPVENGEKYFTLDEKISVPSSIPKMQKLIRYEIRPEVVEKKIVSDKVVFRGLCVCHILCRCEDGGLYSWNEDIPFSQYASLDKEYDSNSLIGIMPAITGIELEEDTENSIHLKVGITGQYMIFDRKLIGVLEDVYSPCRDIKTMESEISIPGLLEMKTESVPVEINAQIDAIRVADIAFYPEHPAVYTEDEKACAELSGTVQMVYYDTDGQLQCDLQRWTQDWSVPISSDSKMTMRVHPTGNTQESLNGGDVTVRCELSLQSVTRSLMNKSVISGIEIGEKKINAERPALIVQRSGEHTLWQIAKINGSTVEMIMNANGLQGEPIKDQFLLIPVL